MKKLLATLALLAACQFDTSDPIDPAPASPTRATAADPHVDDEGECTTPDHAAPAAVLRLGPSQTRDLAQDERQTAADPRMRRGAAAKDQPALAAPAWTPPPVAPEVLTAQERYAAEAAALATRLSGDELAAAQRDLKEH